MLTEGHGIPIGLEVAGANRNDMKLLRATIESLVVERPQPTAEQPQGMCLDKGYDYNEVRTTLKEFGFTAHIVARRDRRTGQLAGSSQCAGPQARHLPRALTSHPKHHTP